jgi:hypothetical protein
MNEITAIELQQPNPPPLAPVESQAAGSVEWSGESNEEAYVDYPEPPFPDGTGSTIDFFA